MKQERGFFPYFLGNIPVDEAGVIQDWPRQPLTSRLKRAEDCQAHLVTGIGESITKNG